MMDLSTPFGQVVKRHLEDEYFIWLTTVDSKLIPQPRPVWFIWENDSFLIFSKPDAHKVEHIRRNPKVALNFNTDETGDQHVIVVNGEAAFDVDCPAAHEVPAYLKKYESGIIALNMTPQAFSVEYSRAIRIKPTNVRGWE